MTVKFLDLDTEKQERIINAAIGEFSKKGYDNASTNEIVRKANISKGILFHYFGNKKGLFLFLYDYCMDKCINEYYKIVNLNEKDIILRLKESAIIKMKLIKIFPEIFKFVQNAYMENSKEVKAELEVRNAELIKVNYAKIFENIDTSLFKNGIDISKAINIIIWTLEGYSISQIEKARLHSGGSTDYEAIFADADEYLEMLRKCLYK